MKVKIGSQVYDSDEEPIMLILDEAEKKKIGSMHPADSLYCAYPPGTPMEEIVVFMGPKANRIGCEHVSAYKVKGVRYCASCHTVLPYARPAEET